MGNDLISRSALIEEFRKCYTSFNNTEMENSYSLMSFKSICKIIKRQPKAYDIDKVVEQLEENTMTVYTREYGNIDVVDIDTLTDIVKAGGINE